MEKDFLLQQVNFGVAADSRIAILGANGQGTLLDQEIEQNPPFAILFIQLTPLRTIRKDHTAELNHGPAKAIEGDCIN